MKRGIIHSKWHKIADPFKCNVSIEVNNYNGVNADMLQQYIDRDVIANMFTLYDTLPKYVMYDDIVSLVFNDQSPLHKSVQAMVEADLAHLPFPEMLVEFNMNKEITEESFTGSITQHVKAREFVWIGEKEGGMLKEAPGFPLWAVPMTMTELPDRRYPLIVLNSNCLVGRYLRASETDGAMVGIGYRNYLSPFFRKDMPKHIRNGLMESNSGNAMRSASCALTATIALLRTRGIVQDRIEAPAKLNKSRVASGKPPIRDHTVIRIGHVYDRRGDQVAYNSTGRKMPVHWRAGHIRNQRFGPGRSKSYELFIEPMLINYNEGDDVPVPVKEVTV